MALSFINNDSWFYLAGFYCFWYLIEHRSILHTVHKRCLIVVWFYWLSISYYQSMRCFLDRGKAGEAPPATKKPHRVGNSRSAKRSHKNLNSCQFSCIITRACCKTHTNTVMVLTLSQKNRKCVRMSELNSHAHWLNHVMHATLNLRVSFGYYCALFIHSYT